MVTLPTTLFMLTDLILLFGGKRPSLARFKQATQHLSEQERAEWIRKIFWIALSQWPHANGTYQSFIKNVIIAYRQQFIDYYREETVMGKLLLPVNEPDALILIFKVWYQYDCDGERSMRHLMFGLALLFDQPYTLKSLCNRVAVLKIEPGDLLDIYGFARIK